MGKHPINLPDDVYTVKKLLYMVTSKEGGPVNSDWPICDPNSASAKTYDPALQRLILDFQKARKSKGARLQGEETAGGRVMPGSATLAELVRVSTICSQRLQDSAPDPSTYFTPVSQTGPLVNWNPAPPPTPSLPGASDTFGDFVEGIVGSKTDWEVSSGAGFSLGIGVFGMGVGSMKITRPDKTSFGVATFCASAGVSLAPASLSFTGTATPGGGIGGVFKVGGGPLVDDDFVGPYASVSGSVTGVYGGGIGVGILFTGYGKGFHLNWSMLAALATGPVGALLHALKAPARAVAMSWGAQYGSPDLGASLTIGLGSTPKSADEWTGRLDKFGPKM